MSSSNRFNSVGYCSFMDLSDTAEYRKKRLQDFVDQKFAGNKAALGRALGYRDGAFVGQMLRGERPITEKTIDQIHELPGGKGWFNTNVLVNVTPVPIGGNRIPMINYVQAGIWTDVVDSLQPGDADDWLMTDLRLSNHAFALEIKGDSMLPEFKSGDRVIIDPEIAPQPGDFVVAKNGGNEATFKKYRPRGTDESGNTIFELVPLNEDFESLRSDQQPIRIVGTMVEHRKYRKPR